MKRNLQKNRATLLRRIIPASLLMLLPALAGAETWAVLNNGINVPGFRNIVVDKNSPSTLYATADGHVYKSLSNGASWSDKSLGLPAGTGITAIVMDPNNPASLIAGTWGGGVYQSTNGGDTWTPANTGLVANELIYSLVVNNASPATMYAATGGGLYRATLGTTGITWSKTNLSLYSPNAVVAIAADPTNSSVIYAATGGMYQAGQFYKSTNSGYSWVPIGAYFGNGQVTSILVDPASPSTVYVGVADWYFNQDTSGAYKSTNGGSSWTKLNTQTGYATPIISLAIAPGNPSTIYAGVYSCSMIKSRDGGATWTPFASGGVINKVTVNPANPLVLYGVTDYIGCGNFNGLHKTITRDDFNGDGKSDIFWQNTSTGEQAIWIMDGTTKTASSGRINSGIFTGLSKNPWQIVGTGDFNGDGLPETVMQRYVNGVFSYSAWTISRRPWLETTKGGQQRVYDKTGEIALPSPGGTWVLAGVGDFNGDGLTDTLWENGPTNRQVWLNKGDGTYWTSGYSFAPAVSYGYRTAAVGDFDGDGLADIVGEYSGNKVMLFQNKTATLLSSTPASWSVAGTGDFNGDGKLDLLWTDNNTGNRYVWFMDGATKLGEASLGYVGGEWGIRNSTPW